MNKCATCNRPVGEMGHRCPIKGAQIQVERARIKANPYASQMDVQQRLRNLDYANVWSGVRRV